MSNIGSLKQQAELLLAKLTQGSYYKIADLDARLQKASAEFPQDTVIRSVAQVIEQMKNKNPSQLVSQGEFEGLYQQLVGLNASGTYFREVLGDLLLSKPVENANQNERYIAGMRDDPAQTSLEYEGDKDIRNSFDKMFAPTLDKYDPQLASKAKEKVNAELVSLGFDNNKIALLGGNSSFVVFSSDFDTNRGKIRVIIPADASGTKLPSVFVDGNRFSELTKANLKNYVEKEAYKKLPDVSAVLNSITTDLVIPSVPTPEPLKAIASQIEESILETAVGYPQPAVRLAKRMLLVEFASMGFTGTQIRVASPTQDGFVCEATLNTPNGKVAIEVPIEMRGNVPLMPTVFAKDDFVDNFTPEKLQAFAVKDHANEAFVNRDSSFMSMDIHQLKDIIIRSASTGNLDICDDVLEIISQKFDADTYRNVVADYQKILMNVKNAQDLLVQSYNDSDQFVKSPNSIYPIHKKFGKPAHELVRDENGEYHLKSTYYARQNEEAYGSFFETAKILVGGDK